jgi:hypothetical protein
MFPLTADAHAALHDSITRHGIKGTVDVDEDGNILDGHEVYRIAEQLGIPCPYAVVADLSEADKLVYAARKNLARRQVGPIQRGYVLLWLRQAMGIAAGRGGDRRSTASVARGSIKDLAALFGWSERSAIRWMRQAEPFRGDPRRASAADEGLLPMSKAVATASRARQIALGLNVDLAFDTTPKEIAAGFPKVLDTFTKLATLVRSHQRGSLKELGRQRSARLGNPYLSDEEIVACGMLEASEYAEAFESLARALKRAVDDNGGYPSMWEGLGVGKREQST